MKVDIAIKGALLEAMDEFHRVCEQNNLKYFLIGGALIGAIRHKGCIPWDDDLDVIMFRKDFEKLLLLKNEFAEGIKLRHRTFPDSLMLPIARVENTKIVIDEGYSSRRATGVFVDVFCFQDTFSSSFLQRLHFKSVGFARMLLGLKEKTYSRSKYSPAFLSFLDSLSLLFNLLPRFVLNRFITLFEIIGLIGGEKKHVANLHGFWKMKEIADKKLFKKRRLYEFEGRKYWSIEDADAWLRPIYGDYMQLPPEEDRKPKHIDRVVSVNGVKVDL